MRCDESRSATGRRAGWRPLPRRERSHTPEVLLPVAPLFNVTQQPHSPPTRFLFVFACAYVTSRQRPTQLFCRFLVLQRDEGEGILGDLVLLKHIGHDLAGEGDEAHVNQLSADCRLAQVLPQMGVMKAVVAGA